MQGGTDVAPNALVITLGYSLALFIIASFTLLMRLFGPSSSCAPPIIAKLRLLVTMLLLLEFCRHFVAEGLTASQVQPFGTSYR